MAGTATTHCGSGRAAASGSVCVPCRRCRGRDRRRSGRPERCVPTVRFPDHDADRGGSALTPRDRGDLPGDDGSAEQTSPRVHTAYELVGAPDEPEATDRPSQQVVHRRAVTDHEAHGPTGTDGPERPVRELGDGDVTGRPILEPPPPGSRCHPSTLARGRRPRRTTCARFIPVDVDRVRSCPGGLVLVESGSWVRRRSVHRHRATVAPRRRGTDHLAPIRPIRVPDPRAARRLRHGCVIGTACSACSSGVAGVQLVDGPERRSLPPRPGRCIVPIITAPTGIAATSGPRNGRRCSGINGKQFDDLMVPLGGSACSATCAG